jgi:transposase
MQQVMSGEKTVMEACKLLEVSERQGYRILGQVRKKGALGVIHGNRGKPSSRRIADQIVGRVISLREGVYKGFNDRHYTDDLNGEEGIKIGRESVRKILREAGIRTPRPVKKRKHRHRRKPKEKFGEMLQGDSSPHDYLEGRGPRLELVHFIDDATNYEWADFFLSENTEAYFTVMMDILKKRGIPQSVYIDKDSVFRVNRDQTLAEQLSGKRPLTQFGRAMEELCIHMIYADSPQAKGRVERRGSLHQDRLISELRKSKSCTLEEARSVLKKHMTKINRQFAKKTKGFASAFTPLPDNCDLKQIICWKEIRTIANDNTFSFQGKNYQIPKSSLRDNWVKCKVALHLCLDGSLHVFYKKERIAYFRKTKVDKNKLPTAPERSKALDTHSPTMTFSLGH